PLPGGGWRPLRLGEFVLGFPDEDGQTNEGPDPRLMRHGTFVVYRRLQQRVGEFRRMLGEASDLTGLPPELVAAKLVGRWRDGTPLELAPDRVPTDLTDRQAPDLSNDFRYLPHDRVGEMCPRGAHVRRTNPRDSLDFGGVVASGGVLSARHRIIRRGMPYGSPLAPDAEEDDLDRGLLFVCFNADIERQFETVQGDWCSDGDAMGLGEDCDPLAGTGPLRKLTVPVAGGAPAFIPVGRAVVVTRGAEYLLAPSRSALHGLAHRSFA
ncbi:MAG: peroxidase, partial [Nocardioidaceae bacterium]